MTNPKKQYSFIFEQTSIVSPSDIKILEEAKLPSGEPRVAFQARLQESEVKNNNRRIYTNAICESITNQLAPKANARGLLMEIDHPMFFAGNTDPMQLKKRATIVEINNAGAVCRKIGFKNGEIIGEMETLSGFKGPDLAKLITKDKVNIGFSLRALGGVEPMQDGTLMVKDPIMPITYDIVSNPSHANARVMQFLPETDMSLLSEADSVICEGEEFELLQEQQITVCDGNVCMRKFIDDVIAEQFMRVVSKKIKFNI